MFIKRANHILALIIGLLTLFLVSGTYFIKANFGKVGLDQLLFLVTENTQGANTTIVGDYFRFMSILLPLFLSVFFAASFFIAHFKHRFFFLKYVTDNEEYPDGGNRIVIFLFVLCGAGTVFYMNENLNIVEYVSGQSESSSLFEMYYADPDETELTFPEEKQNLVYIVLESMEANFSAIEIGGETVNLIPNLEAIALDNTSFTSGGQKIGGPYTMSGLSWTSASLVGQTAGIPLKLEISDSAKQDLTSFLPGVTTLGEILQDEGYANYLMIGSDGDFGSRKTYFETHGDYVVMDLQYMKDNSKLPQDYNVFWGYEDGKLFEFAKEQLTALGESGQPFNLTLLTVDTHFMEGYLDEGAPEPYSDNYANAYAESDRKLGDFIEWIQQQSFYENTTIVITGDHDTMNAEFNEKVTQTPTALYNAILNPRAEAIETSREYTVMDLFPTTLAALGVDISGDRLGLGTNLFSAELTLTELLGTEQLNLQLQMGSDYYEEHFVQPLSVD